MAIVTDISISLIDKIESKVSHEKNVRLLWAAMLIGESVNTSSFVSNALNCILSFNDLPEKQKIVLYLEWQKANPNATPAFIEELTNTLNTLYAHIVRGRNTKGKTKEHILILMKSEKDLKIALNEYKTAIEIFCENLHIAALLPFACNEVDKWNTPMLVWNLPEEETEKRVHEKIKVVADSINDSGWFPLFDSMIKEQVNCADINTANKKGSVQLISDLILEFPEPIALSSGQVHIVRNDFSKTSWKFFYEMKKLNEELKDISFIENNFEQITSLYKERSASFKSAMQQTANQNECLCKLKADDKDIKTYKLYASLSSFNTILNFYKNLDIINEGTLLYAKESISQKGDINNTRLFLILET